MNDAMGLVMALAGGITIGVVFFATLWQTIHYGLSSAYPATCFFISLLLRTVVAITGFHYFTRGSSEKLLLCLFGFFTSHQIAVWFAQAAGKKIITASGDST